MKTPHKEAWEERETIHKFVDGLNGRCLTSGIPVPKIGVRKKLDGMIDALLASQRAEFLNQPMNVHDQEVRKQVIGEVVEKLKGMEWEEDWRKIQGFTASEKISVARTNSIYNQAIYDIIKSLTEKGDE